MADDRAPSTSAAGDATLPADIDTTKPSIARLYDHVLGGKQNFEIDRQAAKALFSAVPEMHQLALDSRQMLRRIVTWLVAEAGVRQIIDLGSGLPTEGNVHEVAIAADPAVRVVYVDIDPIVLAHGRALLADESTSTFIQADASNAATIMNHPDLTALIDTAEPFAFIVSGLLHHFPDEKAAATAASIRGQLTPGSYVAFMNFVDDDEPRAKELERAFLDGGLGTGRFRTWAELHEFFEDLEMVEPGLVYANDWRADDQTLTDSPTHTLYAGGVARKPA